MVHLTSRKGIDVVPMFVEEVGDQHVHNSTMPIQFIQGEGKDVQALTEHVMTTALEPSRPPSPTNITHDVNDLDLSFNKENVLCDASSPTQKAMVADGDQKFEEPQNKWICQKLGFHQQMTWDASRILDVRKRLLIAMDVAFGMEYLHSKSMIHFDLKSDNLLVNLRDPQRPICKIADLGLSKVKRQTLISGGMRGTLPWMAPELLNGNSSLVSNKVDVFSFGIVMWELITGQEPYHDLHQGTIIGGIVSNTLRPLVPESCDPEWRSLMEQCWSQEPSDRPTFVEIASRLRSMAASLPQK